MFYAGDPVVAAGVADGGASAACAACVAAAPLASFVRISSGTPFSPPSMKFIDQLGNLARLTTGYVESIPLNFAEPRKHSFIEGVRSSFASPAGILNPLQS